MQLWPLRYKLAIVIYKVQIWGKNANYFQVQLWVYINYSSNFIARNFYIISCTVDKLLIAHKCKFISHNSEKSSQNCEILKKKKTQLSFLIFNSVAEMGFHNNLLLKVYLQFYFCSKDEWNSYRFGMTEFPLICLTSKIHRSMSFIKKSSHASLFSSMAILVHQLYQNQH